MENSDRSSWNKKEGDTFTREVGFKNNALKYLEKNGFHIDASLEKLAITEDGNNVEYDAYAVAETSTSTEKTESSTEPSTENVIPEAPEITPPAEVPATKLLNSRPLNSRSTTYELETFEKNALIIFNHYDIPGYSTRLGTEQDARVLTETFEKFGFEVVEHIDKTHSEILAILQELSVKDFSDYGCLGIVVLTHGRENGTLLSKNGAYNETDIIQFLKVSTTQQSLITKPRLLMIQACRGQQDMRGVIVGVATDGEDDDAVYYTLPLEADMLVLHSSYFGKPAHRHNKKGSWFIQTLCEKINELSLTSDIEKIAKAVVREVAISKTNKTWGITKTGDLELFLNKQIPIVSSTLTRELFLRKYQGSMATDCALTTSPRLLATDCECPLRHFEYIKRCLRYFLDETSSPEGSRLLILIESYEDTPHFLMAKKQSIKVVSDFLKENLDNKYLYLHEDENENVVKSL